MTAQAMPKLVTITDVARVLGVPDERLWEWARTGKVKAIRLTCGRHGTASRGRWYVALPDALALIRQCLEPGTTRRAANKGLYRAANRLQDSVHAVGLHPATPPEAGKPVSDALLDP
jgi:hypothetical protein